ncbi:MAG: hypothetical protein ACRC6E_13290 [Fusobacteriaceae bacterium]
MWEEEEEKAFDEMMEKEAILTEEFFREIIEEFKEENEAFNEMLEKEEILLEEFLKEIKEDMEELFKD